MRVVAPQDGEVELGVCTRGRRVVIDVRLVVRNLGEWRRLGVMVILPLPGPSRSHCEGVKRRLGQARSIRRVCDALLLPVIMIWLWVQSCDLEMLEKASG